MLILENIISDRGFKYAVAGGPCVDGAAAKAFVAALKRDKHFARATHNSYAALCRQGAGR